MSCRGCAYDGEDPSHPECQDCLEDLHEYRKWTPASQETTMKTINMMNIAKIIFTDTSGTEMTINNISVAKLESPVNHYYILGHNGDENCSGADVAIDFKSLPNDCSLNRRHCCNLSGKDENTSS